MYERRSLSNHCKHKESRSEPVRGGGNFGLRFSGCRLGQSHRLLLQVLGRESAWKRVEPQVLHLLLRGLLLFEGIEGANQHPRDSIIDADTHNRGHAALTQAFHATDGSRAPGRTAKPHTSFAALRMRR